MADKYDKNGYGGSDFKRNAPQEHAINEQDGDEANPVSDKAGEYMRELLGEKLKIDQAKFPISIKLIDQEVSRVQSLGRIPTKEMRYVDIYREKPIKVSVKVLVPVREHPKFNFVGKLLGPKGNSMKRLQEETMCKMAVLGRGSMKDRKKEEELRQALDPKYAHLADDLHVEICALGPPAEAHARIAFALAEVRKYLIPDNNDVIRQEQIREMLDPAIPSPHAPHVSPDVAPVQRPNRGRGGIFRPVSRGGVGRGGPPRSPVPPSRVMPAKTKIMSILDRARLAMEESIGYEDNYEGVSPGRRDEEPYPHHGHGHYAYEEPSHHHDYYDVSAPPAPTYYQPAVRHHAPDHEYGGSTSSSHHHRSYKGMTPSYKGEGHSGMRRAPSQPRDARYRSSPYSRPAK